tara:strand:- start:1229 stop:2053 length:825 start_codon:yes stop_codon:yes gene_type:complete
MAFLGNAAGALGDRAIGAGSEALGFNTAAEKVAKTGAANDSARVVNDTTRTANDTRMTAAQIKNLEDSFGLNRERFANDVFLGKGHLTVAERSAGTAAGHLAETVRRDQASEAMDAQKLARSGALDEAQIKLLAAQSGQLQAGTNMQNHVQRQMAMSEVLKGIDPKSAQAMFLTQAGQNVEFNGNIEQFIAQVHAAAQKMAQGSMGGGGVPQTTVDKPSMAERGGAFHVAGKALNESVLNPEVASIKAVLLAEKLRAYLMGNPPAEVPQTQVEP